MPLLSRLASLSLLGPLTLAVAPLAAQSVPAGAAPTPVPGFHFPTVGGSLDYSVTASESVLFGYNGNANSSTESLTAISGDVAYLSKSEKYPFSAIYSGGYLFGTSGEPSYSFQNFAFSQVARGKDWNLVVADSVEYLPQTPVSGLSGIPGVGDLGLSSVQLGLSDGLGILTTFGTRITNTASGSLGVDLTGSTTVTGSGAYSVQRFLDSSSPGINSDQVTGTGGVTHRLDQLSNIGASYSWSSSSLSSPYLPAGDSLGFTTQTLLGTYSKQLTPRINLQLNAGPQWISSGSGSTVTAGSLGAAANATLSYSGRVYTSFVNYSRGVNTGAGVTVGSESDLVTASIARQFGRVYGFSGEVGYNGSSSLPNSTFGTFSSHAVVAGIQGNRRFGRYFSGYASYTLQRQNFSGVEPGLNAFNGLTQVVGFGVSYSPRSIFGRH